MRSSNGHQHEKICLWGFANNKGADQPGHPHSLISAFVICLWKVSNVKLHYNRKFRFLVEQPGLSMIWKPRRQVCWSRGPYGVSKPKKTKCTLIGESALLKYRYVVFCYYFTAIPDNLKSQTLQGIVLYIDKFLKSEDANFIHISLWTLVQLLKGEWFHLDAFFYQMTLLLLSG